MPLYPEPGALVTDTSLTEQDRTGVRPREALDGTWLPLEADPFVLLNPELSTTPGPRLTERAQTALREDRLVSVTAAEAARCVPFRPPLNMIFHEPKAFEVREDRIVIRVAVVDDTERAIHVGEVPADSDSGGEQGRSIGRWEGDTLVVRTTFDANGVSDRGIINGVPLSGETRLIERFELSEDRRQLVYAYTIENPKYLVEPFTISAAWAYRPDVELVRLECDAEIAERFLDDLASRSGSRPRSRPETAARSSTSSRG